MSIIVAHSLKEDYELTKAFLQRELRRMQNEECDPSGIRLSNFSKAPIYLKHYLNGLLSTQSYISVKSSKPRAKTKQMT